MRVYPQESRKMRAEIGEAAHRAGPNLAVQGVHEEQRMIHPHVYPTASLVWAGVLVWSGVPIASCGSGDGAMTINASGNAFAFALPGEPYGRVVNGTVSVLEMPEFSTTTDEDGFFSIEGLPVGEEATFVLEHDNFHVTHTKTFILPDEDLERVTFQTPDNLLYALLEGVVEIVSDPEMCQMVSTVTVVGKSIYDEGAHGVPGATVSADPVLGDAHGPIYFNENVLPDRSRTESSDDGGILFVNVPPGDYTVTAVKEGVDFVPVLLKCRANTLVNASPPYGLQALN